MMSGHCTERISLLMASDSMPDMLRERGILKRIAMHACSKR